jgi:hypothetical protein
LTQALRRLAPDPRGMAGGYDNEDRQAELEELRRAKEREARARLEAERKAQALRRDNAPDAGELEHPDEPNPSPIRRPGRGA